MIPLKDDNPRLRFPLVNFVFIGVNILVFFRQMLMPEEVAIAFVHTYGAVPASVVSGEHLYALFTSMFLHGGLMHILGNMLYLFIFGDNIEGLMGHVRYFVFYMLCGLGAALSHVLVEPGSTIPMVGASGAISGVLGAYMVCYPRARVLVLLPVFFYVTTFRIPAIIVLGLWFLTQLTNGLAALGLEVSGGIAWFAHIGGFVIGVILVKLMARDRPLQRVEYY